MLRSRILIPIQIIVGRKTFFIKFREEMISLKNFWQFSDLVLIIFLDLISNTDMEQKIFFLFSLQLSHFPFLRERLRLKECSIPSSLGQSFTYWVSIILRPFLSCALRENMTQYKGHCVHLQK